MALLGWGVCEFVKEESSGWGETKLLKDHSGCDRAEEVGESVRKLAESGLSSAPLVRLILKKKRQIIIIIMKRQNPTFSVV